MEKYVCGACGYEYDPVVGDPDNGIAAGTAFEDLPEDWTCPLCGMGKDVFEKKEQEEIFMTAMHKFSYGLFVLTAKDGDKDNGCIINTALQVTTDPKQVSICVNKANYTHEMIKNTKKFNLSFLTEKTSFDIFTRFGFQSGKDVDKLEGLDEAARADNGIMYLTKSANAMVSVDVSQMIDLGTHTMFIGEVTEDKVLCDDSSCTYQYYFDHIKPAPNAEKTKKKGWVCKICGYVYEGEELPPDFICPICKHGVEDFEPL